ncbi:TetR/AcrR family transcriptional regulator [Paenibacillus gorillae]|uniref:TetR/AcrR family transcriptional regulator n=1 Tax=Paenibacillus gorillae TaxID=1243662 RepID=UPI0004BAF476|nr:TetR/AcrR family transcriptional regulator [Paenibacillus gorillae]
MTEQPPKRKPGRPKADGKNQTMIQIMRTAAFLFMEHGFEKVSLEGVAQACGVTKASVYYYFNNKAQLFTESVLLVLSVALEQTRRIMDGPGSLQERLLKVAEGHMANAHVDFETMMREASAGLSEEQITRIRNAENALNQLLEDVFRQAIADGEIAPANPLLLAHAYIAVMTVRNRKDIVNDKESLQQAAKDIVQLFWNGLAPRKP